MIPIWKDYFVSLGSEESYRYRILNGTTPIYYGRAYKRPDADDVLVRVNDICAVYLRNNLPTFDDGVHTNLPLPTFKVEVLVDGVWSQVDSFVFTPDYSYENDRDLNIMSAPILRRLDGRQMFLASHIGGFIIQLMDAEGVNIKTYGQLGGNGTFCIDLLSYPQATQVVWNGLYTMDIVDTCNEWVLHYKNAFGGWDSLLVEGGVTWEDQLTRKTFEVEYDNSESINRGKTNNRNDVSRRCTIRTGWLTDEESSRMHHLLNSTEVYLQHIMDGSVLPLILTNTSTPYKTFLNQGRKMVDYTIEAEVAHSYTRR